VLRSEDLFSDAASVLRRVTDYLGLEPLPATVTFDRLNASGQQNPESPTDVAQMLRSYYAPHNRRLESLTGRSFGWD
jgi:hypothetical protein